MYNYIQQAFLFVFSILVLTSCYSDVTSSKVNDAVNKKGPKEDLYDKIGHYHNIALDLLRQDKEVQIADMDYPELRDIMIRKMSNSYPQIFNKKRLLEEAADFDNVLIKAGLLSVQETSTNELSKSTRTYSFTNDYHSLLDYLYESGKLNRKLYERMSELYDRRSALLVNEQTISRIEGELNDLTITERELHFVSAFIQTLTASNEYWNRVDKSKKMSGSAFVMKKCAMAVIWSDAAGALYGMMGGPVWSVIEGAIFSSVAELNC